MAISNKEVVQSKRSIASSKRLTNSSKRLIGIQFWGTDRLLPLIRIRYKIVCLDKKKGFKMDGLRKGYPGKV